MHGYVHVNADIYTGILHIKLEIPLFDVKEFWWFSPKKWMNVWKQEVTVSKGPLNTYKTQQYNAMQLPGHKNQD